jgi:hypothetical protein
MGISSMIEQRSRIKNILLRTSLHSALVSEQAMEANKASGLDEDDGDLDIESLFMIWVRLIQVLYAKNRKTSRRSKKKSHVHGLSSFCFYNYYKWKVLKLLLLPFTIRIKKTNIQS